MKMAVFWVVAPCRLVEVYWLIDLMMDSKTSETSVNCYQTIRRYNTEDSHLLSTRFTFSFFPIIRMSLTLMFINAKTYSGKIEMYFFS
jgi:hypothetical protein